jgi:hypothetical protein
MQRLHLDAQSFDFPVERVATHIQTACDLCDIPALVFKGVQ